MYAFKLTAVGSSEGFIVPKEVRTHMNVKKGDTLYATDAPGGAMLLTPYDPDFERQMRLAEEIMREDRDILRALAK